MTNNAAIEGKRPALTNHARSAKSPQFHTDHSTGKSIWLVSGVETYIANHEEHHRTVSFQDEFRTFLKKYGVDYDERYAWD